MESPFVEHLTPTEPQLCALHTHDIRSAEDLLRLTGGGTKDNVFTVEMRTLLNLCNTRLAGLRVYRRNLRSDPQVSVCGTYPNQTVTFCRDPEKVVVSLQNLIPPEWYCPLTHEVFVDPVVLEDGYTYEETAIREWLSRSRTSPMSGKSVRTDPLIVPNRVMRDWIARLS